MTYPFPLVAAMRSRLGCMGMAGAIDGGPRESHEGVWPSVRI